MSTIIRKAFCRFVNYLYIATHGKNSHLSNINSNCNMKLRTLSAIPMTLKPRDNNGSAVSSP